MEIEAHYLAIDWKSEGVARTIERAPVPLKVETNAEGAGAIECTIFNDFHPWLGIRIGLGAGEAAPVFLTALGQEVPMLRVTDPQAGGDWWVQNDGWDQIGKRHLSELQRSPGTYKIKVGDLVLQVENRLSAFGRADIQAYVDDFRGDLLWMILNDAAGATAAGKGATSGVELAETLEKMHAAAKRVLVSPAVTIRESEAPQLVAKVRPNAATFRDYLRNPLARHLPSRVFSESADIAENRYLRYMLEGCIKMAGAYIAASSGQLSFLDRLAFQETERARCNLEMETRHVDAEVFDQQTKEVEGKLNALAALKESVGDRLRGVGRFPIRLDKRYGKDYSFFYTPQEGVRTNEKDQVDYRVVVFPQTLFEKILGCLHFCRNYTIIASAKSELEMTRTGKQFRKLILAEVYEVIPQTDALEKRAQKRRVLEKNNWEVRLSANERRELKREAYAGKLRAEKAALKSKSISASITEIERSQRRLLKIDSELALLGVSSSSIFPTGMRFFSSPDYVACISAFKEITQLIESGGLDLSMLDEISRIGILHASEVYERWCLLKIFSLLVNDFKFDPEDAWQQKLVETSLASARNVSFDFFRDDVGMKVVLSCQSEMPSGRRPDFVLEVYGVSGEQTNHAAPDIKWVEAIVMDAKFRSTWKNGELRQTVDNLQLIKGYGNATKSGRAFILQPCEFTVRPASSPLVWGPHCEYGGLKSHSQGWIQVGLDSSEANSTQHLKRLLMMVFQKAFPQPQALEVGDSNTWSSNSFCFGCGERHVPDAIQAKTTKSGATRWLLDCRRCGVWSVRTHCYDCKATLFKNGTMWTYHQTVADQVTNVICPGCGSHFDADFR